MPIDASIYNAFAPRVQNPQDVTNGLMQQANLGMQMQDSRFAMEQKRRAIADDDAMREDVRASGGDDAALDAALVKRGNIAGLDLHRKGVAERAAKKAAADKDISQTQGYNLDNIQKSTQQLAERWGTVKTPEEAVGLYAQAVKDKLLPFEKANAGVNELEKIRNDPAAFQAYAQAQRQQGMTVAQQFKRMLDEREFDQRARNDLVGQDGKINQTLLGAKTQVARAGASSVSVNTGQKGYENESKLRDAFKSEPIYKDFADMQQAHAQIKAGIKAETPIGDTAAATKIMKLLDPGSVVRESELAIAMAAAGKLDRLKNYADMWITGKKLTPQQRADFGVLADELFDAASQGYNKKRDEYVAAGKRYGLPEEAVGARAKSVKDSAWKVVR